MQVPFKLIQRFAIVGLIASASVASVLIHFQLRESTLIEAVHSQEWQLIEKTQSALVERAHDDARQAFLTAHEGSNLRQAQLLSNALWDDTLAPFLAETQHIDFQRCRRTGARAAARRPSRACLIRSADRVRALPGFAALDERLRNALRDSSVAKIRIADLHGTTLYDPDPTQVGEDRSHQAGWIRAAHGGQPASELRPRVPSTRSGAVDHRDFIVSHLPLRDPLTGETVAVFEVHTDITDDFGQLQHTLADFGQTVANGRAQLGRQWQDHRDDIRRAQEVQFALVAGLLLLLFAVLHGVVRRAQGLIDRQTQESNANRQRLAQSEKMTSLGHMVASVAHQLTTPLAFSKSNVAMALQALNEMAPGIRNAQRAPDRVTAEATVMEASRPLALDADAHRKQLRQVPDQLHLTQNLLGDVRVGLDQMTELVDNLRSFTRPDRGCTSEIDLNTTLASVIYIARAVISPKIRVVQKFSELPRLACVVSQLNQVFLNLIMNAAQAIDGSGQVTVSTVAQGGCVRISIEDTGSGIHDDVLPRIFDPYFTTRPAGTGSGLGLSIAKDIVVNHGGTLSVETRVGRGTTFHIELPIPSAQPT